MWSDTSSGSSSESGSEDEAYATVCLMAHEEDTVCESINTSPSFDGVIDKYDDLAT